MLLGGLIAPITEPDTDTSVGSSGGRPQVKEIAGNGLRSRPTIGFVPPLMKPSSPSNFASISASWGPLWHFCPVVWLMQPTSSSFTDAVFGPVYSPVATPKLHSTTYFLPTVSKVVVEIVPSNLFFAPGPGDQL
jgi:hypothetical protein